MARIIKDEHIEKVLKNAELCKNHQTKKWNFKVTDFIIDDNTFNFTHPTWKNTWCKGGKSKLDTIALIQKYCKECNKPYKKRDLSFVHLVED